MRISVMPGARRRKAVASTQPAHSSCPAVAIITPKIQSSMPLPGEWTESDNGSKPHQDALAAPPVVRNPDHMVSPPHTNSHSPASAARCPAISGAPT